MLESNGQSESRTANVQLTADVSPYNTQVQQAAVETNKFADAVDHLSKRLDGLVARAGKKITIFAAADLAALGAATVQAAAFEKQMSSLNASAAVTGQSFKTLRNNVNDMARHFPVSRQQAIALTETLVNLGIKGKSSLNGLSETFTKLGAASGESTTQLAQSMVELGRQMGNLSANNMDKYANSVLTLSKNAGVAATSIIAFSQAIAPVARVAGMTETQILGISTAFNKAGADGNIAANTFNSMLSDITRQIQNGGPEIAKYSNLLGVTVAQFKKMDSAEQITKIFEALNAQGKGAIRTLDQMNFDGIRTYKSIQAVAQTGGIRQQLNLAATPDDNLDKGAQAAMSGLNDELEMTKNQFQQIGNTIGEVWLPPLTEVMHVFNKILEQVNTIGQVFLKMGSAIAGPLGVMGAVGGVAMQAMGPLAMLGTFRYLRKSRQMDAARTGYAGGEIGEGATASERIFGKIGEVIGDIKGRTPGDGSPSLLSRAGAIPFRVGTSFANAQADFYKQAAGRTQDRPMSMFDRAADSIKNVFSPLGESSREVAKEHIELGRQAKGTGKSVRELGFAMTKLGVQTTRAGVTEAMSLGGAGLSKLSGMVNPYAAVATVGLMGASYLHGQAQNLSETRENPVEYYNGMAKYNDALGIATESTTTFASTLQAATNAIPKAKTVAEGLSVTADKVGIANAPGRKYTEPMVGTLKDTQSAVAFLNAQGKISPEQAQAMSYDMIQKFGSEGSKEIFRLYNKQASGGGSVEAQLGSVSQLGIEATTQDFASKRRGIDKYGGAFLKNTFNTSSGISKSASDVQNQAIGAINTAAARATQEGGQPYGAYTAIRGQGAFLGSTFGQGDTAADLQAVAKMESDMLGGKKLGYDETIGDASTTPEKARAKLWKTLMGKSAGAKEFQRKYIKEAGLTTEQAQEAFMQGGTGANLKQFVPGSPSNLIAKTGALGAYSQIEGGAVQKAVLSPDNINAQYKGIQGLLGKADQLGKGFVGTDAELQKLKATIQDTENPLYKMAVAAQAMNAAMRQDAMSYMGRPQQLGASVENYRAAAAQASSPNAGPDAMERLQSAKQELLAARQNQAAYLKQVLDFSRNYERSVEDRNKNLKRSEDDYQLQVSQSREDFHRSQLRSDQDFNRSMARQAEDAAKNVYDPWQRVFAKYTTSTSSLHQNLKDQNERLQKQMKQLAYLKRMGLSQEAIDQLGLADAGQQQEVARMAADAKAGKGTSLTTISDDARKRGKLSKEFVQSEFNVDYRRARSDYERAQSRAEKDFNRAAQRADKAHKLMLKRNADDWKTQTQRGLEDLHRAGEGMFGSFSALFKKATHSLGANLGKMGDQVMTDLDEIKSKYPELFDPNLESQPPQSAFPAQPSYSPQWGVNGAPAGRSAEGSVATVPTTMLIGEGSSPEGVFPLNASAHGFLASMYTGVSKELATRMHVDGRMPMRGGGSVNKTWIDQSTTFKGITVMADDPRRMARELEDAAKLKKLRRPVAAGGH